MQTEQKFQTEDYSLSYLLHLPKAIDKEEVKKWPLILFLHGAGERGDDMDLVKIHGIGKIADKHEDFPFIAVSPQCPEDSYWPQELDGLSALLDEIVERYPVDTDRIYLTGLSMGGIGGWHLATLYPEKFAAFAPVCGGFSIPGFRTNEFKVPNTSEEMFEKLNTLKELPIWAFHGDQDDIVPVDETIKIIEQLKELGGDAKLTIYEGVGHDSWTETYDNPRLYEWFLQHSKSKKD
jgi:predicted peptidase